MEGYLKRIDLIKYVLLTGILFVSFSCGGSDEGRDTRPADPGGNTPVVPDENFDTLVWSDEFETNGSPDSEKWSYDIGDGCPDLCGWGNNEKQFYTQRPENVIVEDGILKIKAKREQYEGLSFTSTRMLTKDKFEFTYGLVEVKAKLPSGGGTWPAIWMLGANIDLAGWPACGEIDIMEHAGNNQGEVSSALHTPSSFGATVNYGSQVLDDVSDEFHIYTVEWTSQKITFAVDGNIHLSYSPSNKNGNTWPFYADQFLILNIAMGGNVGGIIDANFSESAMEIDYIRVYQ